MASCRQPAGQADTPARRQAGKAGVQARGGGHAGRQGVLNGRQAGVIDGKLQAACWNSFIAETTPLRHTGACCSISVAVGGSLVLFNLM